MPGPKQRLSIFWFRRDLRLEDNHGLFRALTEGKNVQPIFIFDRNILDKLEDKDDRRVTYIHHHISELNKRLEQFGSSLWTFYGDPITIYKELLESFEINGLFANRDYEPYARSRDKAVYDLMAEHGISFRAFKDHVILEKDEVLKDDGTPYTVYTPYSRKWKATLGEHDLDPFPSEDHLDQLSKSAPRKVISLEEMGFEAHAHDWSSGMPDTNLIKRYHNTRNTPAKDGTAKISHHLRFGTISIRAMARLGREHNSKWYNELIWREFYQSILWHFPHVVEQSFRPQYDRIEWRNNEEEFEAWCQGRTGYPIVDAGMRELNETGFMHNRVRMIVASFLTKHLLIDWRWGEAYFARKLIDFELASNNGGWQWASGSGVDAAPYFRVFNPYLQTEKFDPKHIYIKRWVSEFETEDYPDPIVDHKEARIRAIETYKRGLGRE